MTGREHIKVIAERHGLPAEALQEAVNEEFARRAAERQERREEHRRNPAPTTSRFAAITSGAYDPKRRPQGGPRGRAKSTVADRALVPAAVKKWRTTHGLTPNQAQARIGYSPTSCSWRHWESGFAAPPYRTLLLILNATGLPVANEPMATLGDPNLDLEAAAREHRELLAERARRRQERREARRRDPVR